MRWIAVLALLFLAACTGVESQVAPEPLPATEAQPTVAAAPTNTLPPPAVSEAPTETAAAPLPTDASPPATPTETQPVATATAEPVLVDGPYEQTYFRGRADAPLTMIDYSDFL